MEVGCWHKAGLELSRQTGLLLHCPPSLPARHCTTPRVSQSFPASRPPSGQREGGRQRQHARWHSPGGLRVCSVVGAWSVLAATLAGFSHQPVAAPDLLLLLLLPLCSGPAASHNKSVTRKSAHQKLLFKSRCVLKLVAARKAWLANRKTVGLAKRETSAQDGRVFSTGF